MSKTIFIVSFAVFVAVLLSKDAMSAPQWSYSFGGVNGSNLNGESASNSTSNIPGSGYGAEYAANHQNDSSPTSPTVTGGELNIQDSTIPSNTCACTNENSGGDSQQGESQGGENGDAPSNPAGDPSSAASGATDALGGGGGSRK